MLCFLLLTVMVIGLKGQDHAAEASDAATHIAPNSDNFYEIQNHFNNWWEGLSEEDKGDYTNARKHKKYKRWETLWEPRVGRDGSLSKTIQAMQEGQKPMQNLSTMRGGSTKSNTTWQEAGMNQPNFRGTNGHCQDGVGRIVSAAFHPAYNGLHACGVCPINREENTIYAGASIGGLWRSQDGGATWVNMNTDYLANLRVMDITISPYDPNVMHIAGSVFFTENSQSFGPVNYLTTMSIYVTHDGGQNWSLVSAPFDYSVTGNPSNTNGSGNNLYDMEYAFKGGLLAVSDLGIHRSGNYGASWSHNWQSVPTNFTKGPRKIRVNPSNIRQVYLGGEVRYDDFMQGYEADDIYRSTNGGLNFSIWKTIEMLGTSPTNDNDLNLRLTNKGSKDLDIAIIRHDLLISHQDENKIYVVVKARNLGPSYSGGGISNWDSGEERYWLFVTTDGGSNWTSVRRGDLSILRYAAYNSWNIHPADDNIIYVGDFSGTCFGVRRTTDGGATFTTFSGSASAAHNDGHIHADTRTFVFSTNFTPGKQDPHMLIGTDGGMNISYAPAHPSNPNFKNITGRGLGIMQSFRVGCGETNDISIVTGAIDIGSSERETLGGPWDHLKLGDGMDCMVDFTDHNIRYASSQNGNFSRYTGSSSTGINPPGAGSGEWVTPIEMSYQDPKVIFLGYTNLFRSDDRGNNGSWTPIVTNGHGEKITHIAVAPSNENIVYYCIRGTYFNPDRIFKITNAHTTNPSWELISYDGSTDLGTPNSAGFEHNRWIGGLAVSPTDPHLLYIAYSGFDNTPAGAIPYKKVTRVRSMPGLPKTWQHFNRGLPDLPVNCITIDQNTGRLFVGTDRGVYGRLPNDPAWVLFGAGLPNSLVLDLNVAESSGWLRAATYGRGVWEIDLGYGTKSYREGSEEIAANMQTVQFNVAPNPFASRFNLSYELEEPSLVDVSVMDLSGKMLIRSQENRLMEAGSHQMQIDLNDQPQGLYLVLFTINGETHTRKILKKGN